jgi:DNA-directed RNA polymerase sigma subunit (sigma70/sigma32)
MFSLSYLATKETFREVGDRFGVSRDHTYRILNKFTRQLSGHTGCPKIRGTT